MNTNKVKILTNSSWIYYICDDSEEKEKFHNEKKFGGIGKWLVSFPYGQLETYMKHCYNAVESGSIYEVKHNTTTNINNNGYHGIMCFYLNINDFDRHRKILGFLIENQLIRKTKDGKIYNISFKLDEQTRRREYGKDFIPKLVLSDLVDLNTGEWLNTIKKII